MNGFQATAPNNNPRNTTGQINFSTDICHLSTSVKLVRVPKWCRWLAEDVVEFFSGFCYEAANEWMGGGMKLFFLHGFRVLFCVKNKCMNIPLDSWYHQWFDQLVEGAFCALVSAAALLMFTRCNCSFGNGCDKYYCPIHLQRAAIPDMATTECMALCLVNSKTAAVLTATSVIWLLWPSALKYQ